VIGRTPSAVDVHELLFDKNDARIGRFIALLAAAVLLLRWDDGGVGPAPSRHGLAAAADGRRALFAYGARLFVVAFFASDLMARCDWIARTRCSRPPPSPCLSLCPSIRASSSACRAKIAERSPSPEARPA